MSKTCTKCKKDKALSEFGTRIKSTAKGDKIYVFSRCKPCDKESSITWQKANREKHNQRNREYRARKKARFKRKPRQTHEEIIAKANAYRKRRITEDPNFKMCSTLRRRLLHALKGNTKSASALELLGTTVEHLRQHLEAQFLPGMNWKNHGRGNDKWVVDHMMPVGSFDLTQEDQQRQCFHWTNLQPLWDPDNNAKSDKVPDNLRWVDSTTGWVDVDLGS